MKVIPVDMRTLVHAAAAVSMEVAAVAAIVAIVFGTAACTQAPPPARQPPQVMTQAVKKQSLADTSEVVGVVRSRGSVDIRPEVSGYLTSIAVKAGARVAAGQEIMQIDPARQQASVRQAEAATAGAAAELARAQANLASLEASREQRRAELQFAERQSRRIAELYSTNNASRQAFDQVSSELRQARAQVESIQAQIRAQQAAIRGLRSQVAQSRSRVVQGQVELDYYSVKAPIDGRLADIPVRIGDRVGPSTLLTSLVGDEGLELYLPVPIKRATDLKPGLRVELLDDGGNVITTSEIDFVSPRVDSSTQTVLAKCPLDAPSADLVVGRFMQARIVWRQLSLPTVPVLAVLWINTQAFVFVAEDGENGPIARQRPVDIGDIYGQHYAVLSNLNEGERLIVEGAHLLRDGIPIGVTERAAETGTEAAAAAETGSGDDSAQPDNKPSSEE